MQLAVRLYSFPDPVGAPVALAARTCTIQYDLWNEIFRITYIGDGHSRKTIFPTLKAVWNRCVGDPLATIDKSTLGTSNLTLGLLVDADPDPALFRALQDRAGKAAGYGTVTASDPAYGDFTKLFCSPTQAAVRYLLVGAP